MLKKHEIHQGFGWEIYFNMLTFSLKLSSSTNDKIVAMFFTFSLYTHTHQIQTENDPRKVKYI